MGGSFKKGGIPYRYSYQCNYAEKDDEIGKSFFDFDFDINASVQAAGDLKGFPLSGEVRPAFVSLLNYNYRKGGDEVVNDKPNDIKTQSNENGGLVLNSKFAGNFFGFGGGLGGQQTVALETTSKDVSYAKEIEIPTVIPGVAAFREVEYEYGTNKVLSIHEGLKYGLDVALIFGIKSRSKARKFCKILNCD